MAVEHPKLEIFVTCIVIAIPQIKKRPLCVYHVFKLTKIRFPDNFESFHRGNANETAFFLKRDLDEVDLRAIQRCWTRP